jgi:hypothetical protein
MSELPLKATLKAGAGYDAPWLSVDATDPADLELKLNAIANGGAPQALIEAANALKAANNAAPLLNQHQPEPAQQPTAPPQQNSGWGQQQNAAPPQQQAQQPRQQGWQAPATTHPEGKQCDACGQPLEYKKTTSGKATWRCNQWRWNNGSPNEHTQLWA